MDEPYKKGYLPVSDGHQLYFEFCGNPHGKPVLFVHGGPGAGFSNKDKNFFDPKIWNIILFEQRGAGRSKPFASFENNTTQKLVEDIKVLLQFAGISKIVLFGGSWGSTLSLVYAITYPETVAGMLLRGIWLANKEDRKYYTNGGVGIFYPDVWERFIDLVPSEKRNKPDEFYLSQMQSTDKEIQEKYTYEWAYYETALLRLRTSGEQIEHDMASFNYHSLAPLEAYYISNNCFIPENFILNNAQKITHITTTIVHGRYDVICPPQNAYSLHKALPDSKLIWTVAGHSSSDEENRKTLIDEMIRFSKEIDL